MSSLGLYGYSLLAMAVTAMLVFVLLLFMTAPYGRHTRSGWGPRVNSRLGWFIMESPASLLMFAMVLLVPMNFTLVLLLGLWQLHYFHRAFIYPWTLTKDKTMPVAVMVMALLFNGANASLNVWHFHLHASWYELSWLSQWNFIVGVLMFVAGFVMTKRSDSILASLRTGDDQGYHVPHGFLYRWVSCPNYLGECIQWMGWFFMTLSPAAAVFALWTFANLVPRALAHQRWYLANFPDYPRDRKAIIPYLL